MKLKKLVAASCIATMVFALSGCNKALDLSLNLKKGDKYNIHVVNDQKTSVTAENQEIKSSQVMDMNFSIDVKDVDKDKNTTVDYKYDSIKMSAESNGQKMEYDSKKNDSNNPLGAIYGGIIGKGFTVKLDKKGQVLDIKGMNELLDSLVEKIPASDQEKKAVKDALKENFGDEAIKSMVKQTMNYYPQKSIKTGDTWENKYDIKAIFPMSVSNKWKLIGEKDGALNVEVQSTIAADTKNKPIDFMGLKANMKLDGDCKGTIDISKDNGLIQKGSMTQNMNGNMEILASNVTPKNVKMPMKITSKITYETTKK
ncbi:DUF6263 family protein [Clostridium brassicae]|uniref:DUF6263 family protein n=1 Tax=Clostridium brassicae TaxID=2999072 RepID=A0ABT4DDB4_9CLOT|nr:DUF6263 family protein [Clostridium brassicae]MCY6960290.1 DUF6263 family protein [Clostridium brassicae]